MTITGCVVKQENLRQQYGSSRFSPSCVWEAEEDSDAPGPARPLDLQALIRDAMLILQEALETSAGPLRIYRKRIQVRPARPARPPCVHCTLSSLSGFGAVLGLQ